MLTITKLRSGGGALSKYYSVGDYYSKDGAQADRWGGQLSAALGLSGTPKPDTLQMLFDGIVPTTGQELGRMRGGERQHIAGWDLTYSAPKSVSLLHAAGDERIAGLMDQAVSDAMDYMERFAGARTGDGHKTSGKMLYARFQEFHSRALDPQLHVHVPVFNMTSSADVGGLREDGKPHMLSLESHPLYIEKMSGGQVFRSALAMRLKEAGYDLDVDKTTGLFEVRGVPKAAMDLASKRNAEIAKWAEEHGDGTYKSKASYAKNQRPDKVHGSPEDFQAAFETEHAEYLETYDRVIKEALHRDPDPLNPDKRDVARSVSFGLNNAMSPELVVSKGTALRFGLSSAIGDVELKHLEPIIAKQLAAAKLLETPKQTGGKQLAKPVTRQRAATLERQLGIELILSQNAVDPIMSTKAARGALTSAIFPQGKNVKASEHALSDDDRTRLAQVRMQQLKAAQVILSTSERVIGIQGVAGAGKSHLVKALVDVAGDQQTFVAAAPTGKAALELGRSAGIESMTVARLFSTKGKDLGPTTTLIVDESSMLSLRGATGLLAMVREKGARMVLIGDVKQLEAPKAGKPFAVLQKMGMETMRLDTSLRQRTAGLRKIVSAARQGKVAETLNALGDKLEVLSIAVGEDMDPETAHKQLVARATTLYLDQPSAGARLIVLDNATRKAINGQVRDRLKDTGTLDVAQEKTFGVLLDRALTEAQMRRPEFYTEGDMLEWHGTDKTHQFQPGTRLSVKEVGTKTLILTDGKQDFEWNPATGRRAGAVGVYREEERTLTPGDVIQMRARLGYRQMLEAPKGFELKNGMTGTVESIDGTVATIDFGEDKQKQVVRIDLAKHGFWDHGYAVTTHKAQGLSIKHPVIVAPARASHLLTQSNFYTALSRATHDITVLTTDRKDLELQLERTPGGKTSSLEGLDQISDVRSDAALIAKVDAMKARGQFDPPKAKQRARGRHGPHRHSGRWQPHTSRGLRTSRDDLPSGKERVRLWIARLRSGDPTLTYRALQAQDRRKAYEAQREQDTRLHDAFGKPVRGQALVALWKARIEARDPELSYQDMLARHQQRGQHASKDAADMREQECGRATEKARPTSARDKQHDRDAEKRRLEEDRKKQSQTPEKQAQKKEREQTPVRGRGRKKPDLGRER
ncbi:MAG: MobF family relaxase [Pseudomonadota bacterium]